MLPVSTSMRWTRSTSHRLAPAVGWGSLPRPGTRSSLTPSLTRRRCVHHRYFPMLTNIMEAVEGTIEEYRRGNETLRRRCAITQGAPFSRSVP